MRWALGACLRVYIVCLERGTSLCFLITTGVTSPSHPLLYCSASPQALMNGSSCLWTETSEIMSLQLNFYYSKIVLVRSFSNSSKKLTNTLCLVYFTWHHVVHFHPSDCKWQDFIVVYGWILWKFLFKILRTWLIVGNWNNEKWKHEGKTTIKTNSLKYVTFLALSAGGFKSYRYSICNGHEHIK